MARQDSRMVAGAASFTQRPAPLLDLAHLSTTPRYCMGVPADTEPGAQLPGPSDEWRRALLGESLLSTLRLIGSIQQETSLRGLLHAVWG